MITGQILPSSHAPGASERPQRLTARTDGNRPTHATDTDRNPRLAGPLGLSPSGFLGRISSSTATSSASRSSSARSDQASHRGDWPGLGTLTSALLDAGAEVWAVEKDRRLSEYLMATLPPRYPGVCTWWKRRCPGPAGRAAERARDGGLQDRRQSAICDLHSMDGCRPFRSATHPHGVDAPAGGSDRYAARAGTKAFGAISIFLQAAYDFAPGIGLPLPASSAS